MIKKLSVIDLVAHTYSLDTRQAFRSQTSQLSAFCAVALVFAVRMSWKPTDDIDKSLRKELADISALLNIDHAAHQTFIVYVRRMVMKLCYLEEDKSQLEKIIHSTDAAVAHRNLLEYLVSKNIFTAGHMRRWVLQNGMEPLNIKIKKPLIIM